MAKKDKFHSEAPGAVVEMLGEVIGDFHKGLDTTEFLVLFKHGGWNSKGKTVFGKAKVLGDDLRSTWGKDVILYLNADMWGMLSKPQKKYVLDHQLYTLNLKYDRHDNVKEANDGRPLLTSVPPDIEAYTEVVKRHGIIMEDVKRLARAMTETSQITLEDALKFENNENAAADFREKVKEPHEGITGTISQDGTATVVGDVLDMDAVVGGDGESEQEDVESTDDEEFEEEEINVDPEFLDDDGEPSEAEKEIESMESEVVREERERQEDDDLPM